MCGRTGLCLCSADVQSACAYKNNSDTFSKPDWSDEYNLGKEYSPSYNVAPTDVTPVLVAASNFGVGGNSERILKPMMWGMVPPWHKGNWKSHGLSTNNCRLEGIQSSKLFSSSLRNGNRCVILAEGFYEWRTTNPSKQPYYIFVPQDKFVKMEDPTTWNNAFSEAHGWRGIQLMKMAGLYNTWRCDDGVLYSYSVITMEANHTMSWLHHRMPAILETDVQVSEWLDTEQIPMKNALSILKPASKLSWYPVSTAVNNSRNKSQDCNKPLAGSEHNTIPSSTSSEEHGAQTLITRWLKEPTLKRKDIGQLMSNEKKTKK